MEDASAVPVTERGGVVHRAMARSSFATELRAKIYISERRDAIAANMAGKEGSAPQESEQAATAKGRLHH